MKLRYGFMVVLAAAVALTWLMARLIATQGVPMWWAWVVMAAALIWAVRARARDAAFVHAALPALVGTAAPVLLWYLFWDASLDLSYYLGLSVGFALVAGGLSVLGVLLTNSTNPQA